MADQEQETFIDSSGGNSKTDGDLQEEDVWDVLFNGSDESGPEETKPKASSEGGFPKMDSQVQDTLAFVDSEGELPLAFKTPNEEAVAQQPSDPVIISDWSVLDGLKALFEESWALVDDDDDDGDEDESSFIPPHELVAKKFATSERRCSSMREGIGRTLKGRDLFTFRDLVLTKTGFFEGYL